MKRFLISGSILALTVCFAAKAWAAESGSLRVHNIFASNMVIQRGKPIKVWGWARPGGTVTVKLGAEQAEAKAEAAKGRWEVTFPAREASAAPLTLAVVAGDDKVALTNVVVGDVWVMTGQSNMAFPLGKVQHADMEAAQADLPLLRLFSIDPNEQSELAEDIPADKIATAGWAVSTSETAREFSAIGHVFVSRLQRALKIPIGVIKSARGGASIEAIVPSQMFDQDPVARRYAEDVKRKIAAFDPQAASLQIWSNQLARAQGKKLPEDKWPKKPVNAENLSSWNIPGKSASDMGSVHNGMFGVFKGYNIKGVLFHQGYNNAISSNCRPKRYRVLMRLMVEGWREDFNDPDLPVGVIEFCAGGVTQNEDNFESLSHESGPYIREAQRLGLADVANQKNLMFQPGYDVQIPGLHPSKKREHGERAACWALGQIYGLKMTWKTALLVSAESKGDEMILTFDQGVAPDDANSIPRGFSIAGDDGKFYMAYARFQPAPRWYQTKVIHVWSPLVKRPVAVRYGWANSPMGNLKVESNPNCPLPSFRTDKWDWPESEDPAVSLVDRRKGKEMAQEAAERCENRQLKEAQQAVEIQKRLRSLGTN